MDDNELPLIVPPSSRPGDDLDDAVDFAADHAQPPEPPPRQTAVFNRYIQTVLAVWILSVVIIAVAVASFGFRTAVVDPGDGSVDFVAIMGIAGVLLLGPGAIAYGAWFRFRPTNVAARAVAYVAQFLYLGFLAILAIVSWGDSRSEGVAATMWFIGALVFGFAARRTIVGRRPAPTEIINLQDS